MKKLITSMFIVFLFSVPSLYAKSTEKTTKSESDNVSKTAVSVRKSEFNRTLPTRIKVGKWSVAARAGLGVFDGDALQSYNQLMPKGKGKLALNAELEYSFTTIFGLSLLYSCSPIGANTSNIEFEGVVHAPGLMASMNLINWFNHYRKNTRWDVYADIGIGLSFYETESFRTTAPTGPQKIKDGRGVFMLLGVNLEYNISKRFAFTGSIRYLLNSTDNLEAANIVQGVANDNILNATLGLRYKFLCKKEEHIRNIDYATWEGIAYLGSDIDSLKILVNELQNKLNTVDHVVGNVLLEKDTDGDGVPDSRDREPNTPPGAYVNYWGESTAVRNPSVFFKSDRYDLDEEAKIVIRDVALKMIENPEIQLEIRGYADNTGSNAYNIKLSTQRAMVVKQELVNEYKIDESRIIANGLGKLTNPSDTYSLNRRCDFFFDIEHK
jgi:outer membrane protein OmpA-like peptidoglycan-associated protein